MLVASSGVHTPSMQSEPGGHEEFPEHADGGGDVEAVIFNVLDLIPLYSAYIVLFPAVLNFTEKSESATVFSGYISDTLEPYLQEQNSAMA